MANTVLNWVFEKCDAVGSARMVLLTLADRADDRGVAWPGVADIARRARLKRRTAERAIRRLIGTGELVKLRPGGGRKRTNVYVVRAGRTDAELAEIVDCETPSRAPGFSDQLGERNPGNGARKPRQRRRETPARAPGEPMEPKEPPTGVGAAGGRAELVTRLLVDVGVDPRAAAAEAAKPGLTPELVRAAASWASKKPGLDNPAGFVLAMVRKQPAQLVERAHELERQEARTAEVQAEGNRLAEARAVVEAIPDDAWDAAMTDARAEVAAQHGDRNAERWQAEVRRFVNDRGKLTPAEVYPLAKAWRGRIGMTGCASSPTAAKRSAPSWQSTTERGRRM